jgi:hypothetical protein
MAKENEPEGIGRGQLWHERRQAGLKGVGGDVRRGLDVRRRNAARGEGGGISFLQRLEAVAFLLVAGETGDDEYTGRGRRAGGVRGNGQ